MKYATPDTISLVYKHLEMFNQNSVGYCELMVTARGHRHVMFRAYQRFVYLGKITPFENMTLSEQADVRGMAEDIAKNRLKGESLIDLAKNLLVIEYLLRPQKN